MKHGRIEETLRDKGLERGTLHVLLAQQEQITACEKSVKECMLMLHQVVDTITNVVQGVDGMRTQMIKSMASAGLMSEGDDLPESTHMLGKN